MGGVQRQYLAFADIAFTEYLRAVGLGFPNPVGEDGSEIFAVGSEVNWRRPARFDDLLTLKVRVARFGRSSFTAETVMLRAQELLCDVRTTYAMRRRMARGACRCRSGS
jgi:acyl-CoA thioester hydrolase